MREHGGGREDALERDTIAAVATPAGAGGVGIVRVSGPDAAAVASRVLRRDESRFPDRMLVHGVARDERGARIDEVLAVVMRAPRSFTGEDVAEIHGHGGTVNVGRLLRAVLAAGARQAAPGEFTRRAFESGRLDLTRAEAVAGVIEASSERAWRIAQAQLGGALGDAIRARRDAVVGVLADLEVSIDFPEEDLEVAGAAGLAERAGTLASALQDLAASYTVGRALRSGIEVALVGPVNAGKSSLFNALLGRERAIVAAEPGTTRDFVEATAEWDGVPVTLIDTAGERGDGGEVEQRGMELGRERAREADVEVEVVSAEEPAAADPGAGDARRLRVVSKGDLLSSRGVVEALVTSVRTSEGLAELRRAILDRALGRERDADDGVVVTSERQRDSIARSGRAMAEAAAQLCAGAPPEVVAVEVRDASAGLAEVLGDEVGDEMLDDLFSRFCIGK